jgi:hypothetical protein
MFTSVYASFSPTPVACALVGVGTFIFIFRNQCPDLLDYKLVWDITAIPKVQQKQFCFVVAF